QAEPDAEHEGRQNRPAPGDGGRATAIPAGIEGGETAGEDGDDGEADGEVGEPGPGAVELLLVAHPRQFLLVQGESREVDFLFVYGTFGHVHPPLSGGRSAGIAAGVAGTIASLF